MVKAKYFYVYYAPSYDQYNWSIREEDKDFYKMVLDGIHLECEFIYGALVEAKHSSVLEALLEKMNDYSEYISAIKLFSEFIWRRC